MKQSLILHLQKKTFRQKYQAAVEKANSPLTADPTLDLANTMDNAAFEYAEKAGIAKRARKKKTQVIKSATPQELEKKAMDALVELRLKKKSIFARIKERRERKAKEKLEKEAKGQPVDKPQGLPVPEPIPATSKKQFMVGRVYFYS
ncbi:hypothetical protein HDU91_001454 [Kappamyces sp. JEL0680]|nr:hypothetical protein HDU91_001454 [Kappamyces sp. JEL0680]